MSYIPENALIVQSDPSSNKTTINYWQISRKRTSSTKRYNSKYLWVYWNSKTTLRNSTM